MIDETPHEEEPVGPAILEPPPRTSPVAPSELDVDTERAMLAGILPGSEGRTMRGTAKKIMGASTPLGAFVAGRMTRRSKREESELLQHRARVAVVDGATLASVRYFNELGRAKPNKVILDGCLAVMRGTGLLQESAPISAAARDEKMNDDRAAASMSNEELLARQAERLRVLSAGKKEDS